MKINIKRELQNIATNKDFWRFTENAQNNCILFWQLILRYQQDFWSSKNFGCKNIDKLKDNLENTATKKEHDKLFNNINDGVNILKKLVKAVSNNVEKKRINNVIKAVNVILKHF